MRAVLLYGRLLRLDGVVRVRVRVNELVEELGGLLANVALRYDEGAGPLRQIGNRVCRSRSAGAQARAGVGLGLHPRAGRAQCGHDWASSATTRTQWESRRGKEGWELRPLKGRCAMLLPGS